MGNKLECNGGRSKSAQEDDENKSTKHVATLAMQYCCLAATSIRDRLKTKYNPSNNVEILKPVTDLSSTNTCCRCQRSLSQMQRDNKSVAPRTHFVRRNFYKLRCWCRSVTANRRGFMSGFVFKGSFGHFSPLARNFKLILASNERTARVGTYKQARTGTHGRLYKRAVSCVLPNLPTYFHKEGASNKSRFVGQLGRHFR